MDTNDKLERLLDMVDHPEQYSEEEMHKLLDDDECQELYELMVKTDEAYTKPSDANVEKALQSFENHHKHTFDWRRMAAIFIGILVVSCITYAGITLIRPAFMPKAKTTETATEKAASIRNGSGKSDVLMQDTLATNEKVFDDVELQNILEEISAYYHLTVEYHSDEARHLRLHYNWDKTQDVETVIVALNHFEKVNLIYADGKILVK